MRRSKPGIFWGVTGSVLLVDAFTKVVAVDRLIPAYLPRPLWGEGLRLTLVYNPGAAFGLHLGAQSRWIFIALTMVALLVLGRLYLETPLVDRLRALALALVSGGALGNLLDRLKSGRGVVDFIDVGVGDWRWPTFNVADIAVTSGAFLLALVLWRADTSEEQSSAAQASALAAVPADAPADAPTVVSDAASTAAPDPSSLGVAG
ncbi:MAG: signal peptidase II [Gemmatimonadetes bacterium]|nr:signal peptidase II [Gemmatimonadota bacterium]